MSDSLSSESKPKPCFTHLPWFLKQRIVDNTDLITRCRLRKVSKELTHRVNKSPLHINEIIMYFCAKGCILFITTDELLRLVYVDRNVHSKEKHEDGLVRLHGPDPVKRLVKDLATLLRYPNMTLGEMLVSYSVNDKAYLTGGQYPIDRAVLHETFKQEFDKLPHQLNVGALKTVVLSEHDAMLFVPYMKPGVLKEMILAIINSDGVLQEVELTRVKETEQWKQSETSKKEE